MVNDHSEYEYQTETLVAESSCAGKSCTTLNPYTGGWQQKSHFFGLKPASKSFEKMKKKHGVIGHAEHEKQGFT